MRLTGCPPRVLDVTAMPRSKEARRFYRAAVQRFAEAELLYEDQRLTTAAVYLAGYAVECILKAVLLSAAPQAQMDHILTEFKGAKAHSYEWLLARYREHGGPALPKELVHHFTRVNSWSTDMRYAPGMTKLSEAKAFIDSTAEIIRWADGRMGQ